MQEPDNKDGYYYVSCVDYKRTGFILGPFKNDHAKALSMVAAARDLARDKVPASFCIVGVHYAYLLMLLHQKVYLTNFFLNALLPKLENITILPTLHLLRMMGWTLLR